MAKPSDIYGTNRPNLLPRETKFASTSQQDWTPMMIDRRHRGKAGGRSRDLARSRRGI